jgi:putative ATP-binding cassette transporter
MPRFLQQALVYVGVFAAATTVAVLYRFLEERLGLLWRAWLTKRATAGYLEQRTYLRLKQSADVDNPDQRIAEDIRAFSVTTLSFALISLNGLLTAVSFSGVLWTISPLLFAIAVGYAALGTAMAIVLGRPLVGLNYTQLAREADFRATLIHVRENAESVALSHSERGLSERLLQRIDQLVQNFRRIVSINRNLGFFTTGYNYLIQLIPALLVAPQFIRGEVEFGVITQSALAFTQLLGAFSLIVNQFASISALGAVIARLSGFVQALDSMQVDRRSIDTREDRERVAYQGLTLQAARDGAVLVKDLSVVVPRGMRVLVTGPNDAGRAVLFRATAGIWSFGRGCIVRPPPEAIFFVPQQPYVVPGTLRQTVVGMLAERKMSDERILAAFDEAGLNLVVKRIGGLDVEQEWGQMLSLREQQQLVFIRLLLAEPAFAVLDQASTTLGSAELEQWLPRLSRHGITYISFDGAAHCLELYDAVLKIDADGAWNWQQQEPDSWVRRAHDPAT